MALGSMISPNWLTPPRPRHLSGLFD
uniref:Uncharacterized protein n=1 Tax=Anguilla anguilla TaxID=7936 RepID=A0A0E9VYW4_ANGAN